MEFLEPLWLRKIEDTAVSFLGGHWRTVDTGARSPAVCALHTEGVEAGALPDPSATCLMGQKHTGQ